MFEVGSICNQFYSLAFIQNKTVPNLGSLYHITHKKTPYHDAATEQAVKTDSINGIDLDSFTFDIFPLSECMAVLDAAREDEFSPVKNP